MSKLAKNLLLQSCQNVVWITTQKNRALPAIDPVVNRVKRNDRLGCFVDRLDRLHRQVDDLTTRLDLADF